MLHFPASSQLATGLLMVSSFTLATLSSEDILRQPSRLADTATAIPGIAQPAFAGLPVFFP
jgi:hypothetical protein